MAHKTLNFCSTAGVVRKLSFFRSAERCWVLAQKVPLVISEWLYACWCHNGACNLLVILTGELEGNWNVIKIQHCFSQPHTILAEVQVSEKSACDFCLQRRTCSASLLVRLEWIQTINKKGFSYLRLFKVWNFFIWVRMFQLPL